MFIFWWCPNEERIKHNSKDLIGINSIGQEHLRKLDPINKIKSLKPIAKPTNKLWKFFIKTVKKMRNHGAIVKKCLGTVYLVPQTRAKT
jgi:hypothetical protein